MTRVFLAGPIDYQPIEDVIESRMRLHQAVIDGGFSPVDQYSDAIEQFTSFDLGSDDFDSTRFADVLDSIPDEPYVQAFRSVADEHSIELILESPELIPKTMSEEQLEKIVERDLELVATTDVVLAHLPTPSCGTTVEILTAVTNDTPVVVMSDSPPIFIRYYADEIISSLDKAIDVLERATA